MAKKCGAKLVINSDAHIHSDFLTEEHRENVLLGCGISREEVKDIYNNMEILLSRLM